MLIMEVLRCLAIVSGYVHYPRPSESPRDERTTKEERRLTVAGLPEPSNSRYL